MKFSWLVLGALASGTAAGQSGGCQAVSGAHVLPVLELYTSEGCSSCPPADRWLSALVASGRRDVLPLVFHVDYWDNLGWKDRFADSQHTARQRRRVTAEGGDTIYTPQTMLGAETRLNWRDNASWQAALASEARRPSPARLTLRAHADAEGLTAELSAELDMSARRDQSWLYLVLYSDGMLTRVPAGENAGSTLHHDHVVRRLLGPWSLPASGRGIVSQRIAWPREAGSRWGLAAFVENRDSGVPWQAVDLPLGACR